MTRRKPTGSTMLKHAAVASDRLRKPPSGITVLLYHRVGAGTDSLVDLDVPVFRSQMAHLATSCRLLSLDAAIKELRAIPHPSGSERPATESQRPAVVVTFDDGTEDFINHALPALVENQVPATLYVATHFVEQRARWPDGSPAISWTALAECLETGLVTIGSHTHRHVLLDRSNPGEVAADLDRSVSLLEDHLDCPVEHFAYPKAVLPTRACEQLVRQRFSSAALAGNRPNPIRCDVHRLWRTPIQTTDTHRFFRAKLSGGMRLEATAREAANRFRYRRSSE